MVYKEQVKHDYELFLQWVKKDFADKKAEAVPQFDQSENNSDGADKEVTAIQANDKEDAEVDSIENTDFDATVQLNDNAKVALIETADDTVTVQLNDNNELEADSGEMKDNVDTVPKHDSSQPVSHSVTDI
jgi:hypothetical protein